MMREYKKVANRGN